METINPGVTGRGSDDGTSSLVPSRKVLERYLISDRTLDRWTANPALSFPQPIFINKRRYWRISELAEWERSRAKGGAAEVVS
jgi:hypothetical protein